MHEVYVYLPFQELYIKRIFVTDPNLEQVLGQAASRNESPERQRLAVPQQRIELFYGAQRDDSAALAVVPGQHGRSHRGSGLHSATLLAVSLLLRIQSHGGIA